MKLIAITVDAEVAGVDYLEAGLVLQGEDVTVGAHEPTDWSTATKPHVQIALDGTPNATYPATAAATVRITVWATSTGEAKRLARLSQAVIVAHPGGAGVQSVQHLTGVLPTRDPDTHAELATCTVRMNLGYTTV